MKTILELRDGSCVTIESANAQGIANDVAQFIANNYVGSATAQTNEEEPLEVPVIDFLSAVSQSERRSAPAPVTNVPPSGETDEEPLLVPTLS